MKPCISFPRLQLSSRLALTVQAAAAPFRGTIPARAAPRRAASTVLAAAAAPPGEVTTQEEILENSKVRLTVTVPKDRCAKAYRAVLKEWNSKLAITGYRKGKAPDDVLIDQLGGQQRVYNTVLSELIEEVLGPALESTPSAAKAIADSESIEQSADELEKAFNPSEDFTFSVMFETLPELKWKTPYKDLAVTVAAPSSKEADAEKARAKLRALQKERGGQLRVVTGRGVQKGDVVIIDFDASVAETGEKIPGAAREAMQLDTDTGDESFLPGVVATLLGATAGEEKDTTLTFPTSEDFSPASLRGVTAAVHVKVSEVFEWELPEASDEWAASVMGPGSTMADVTARLLENTEAESEEQLQQRIADALTDAVAAAVEVYIPDALIQETGQNEYSRELNQLITKGIMSFEQASKLATPQMVAQYISRKRPELEALQRSTLGFSHILQAEGLAPSEAAIAEEFEAAMESVRSVQREGDVNEEGVYAQVVQGLEVQAVMDWLVANCKVTVTPYAA